MKRLTLITLLLSSIIMFTGCQKDACDTTTCLNGGVCDDGDCLCPEGFTGSDCSQQETPDRIRIKNIRVTRFPATEANGGGWDLTSGPDIYPELFFGNTSIFESNVYFPNADPINDFDFELVPSVELTNPTSEYIIRLYDFDELDADDFMGGIAFTPYSSTGGFPSTISLDAGGDVAFVLDVEYDW